MASSVAEVIDDARRCAEDRPRGFCDPALKSIIPPCSESRNAPYVNRDKMWFYYPDFIAESGITAPNPRRSRFRTSVRLIWRRLRGGACSPAARDRRGIAVRVRGGAEAEAAHDLHGLRERPDGALNRSLSCSARSCSTSSPRPRRARSRGRTFTDARAARRLADRGER